MTACVRALFAVLDPARRADLPRRGAARVNELFAQERVVAQTLDAWALALGAAGTPTAV